MFMYESTDIRLPLYSMPHFSFTITGYTSRENTCEGCAGVKSSNSHMYNNVNAFVRIILPCP